VKEAAHSLKGAISNFQATNAVELAQSLEVMGSNGDLHGAEEKLVTLEAEMRRIDVALAALRLEVAA
jgi:HPt (histidine-containing phosphotransfer) domain-containing protein